ncbi:MATE family efflux transporter [Hominifimenecus sp. rT4P-3]|uniref:MATE family efflux transporter n=1 Tax=Hominifimenecus sp. rT4P-3 TaxID=3242979 RepID=UPI003DA21CD3
MQQDLLSGGITKNLLRFALPMMLGSLLQQLYNVADTLIVGRFLGANALAAVGSSYTLMTFLTSILLGLCMGSGAVFAVSYGEKNEEKLKASIFHSFLLIAVISLLINLLVLLGIDPIIRLLQVPEELRGLMRAYLWIIFWGISATFLYNYFASLLRAVGDSVTPLIFLGVSAGLNIGLDFLFVLGFQWGVEGAAIATVAAQYVSGIGIVVYTRRRFPQLAISKRHMVWKPEILKEIASLSFLTCVQQSVMNFGILMVQGIVNRFGAAVMAAFAAAVKIDSFAYMPVQEFGNAFSTFIAQNYGARKFQRITRGTRSAVCTSLAFSAAVSAVVCIFARPLMQIFIQPEETEIIAVGVGYLRIEGAFYAGIGLLFLLYGFYRAIKMPGMSVVLTVISLGTRVGLAYVLSAVPSIGVTGIWAAVPIGWGLADLAGVWYYQRKKRDLFCR